VYDVCCVDVSGAYPRMSGLEAHEQGAELKGRFF
jgi:hypothetical protein